jgi:membrane protein DedA with SNARE-associated domain
MESIANYICAHADWAHILFFCCLLLAGMNIPISEDLVLITGGMIAGTCIPEHTLRLYLWIFVGCYVSAWEAYWIGRLLGPKLYRIRWFSHIVTEKRVARLNYYYEKYGIFTFIVGRFVPGGVRNALFMTAGLGKMAFPVFIFRDGIACIISTITLFSIGYLFGEHYQLLLHYFKTYNLIFLGLLLFLISSILLFIWYKRWVKKNLGSP